MSREIELRCWNEHGKCFHRMSELGDKLHLFHNKNPSYVIEQFTGLLDCNVVKIFEGDILLITEIDEDSSSGAEFTNEPVAVVWRNLQWMFDNRKYKVLGQKDWTDYATLSSYCRHNVDFKVIGNIHQNSELLK